MRSLYIENFADTGEYILSDSKKVHHWLHVIKVKKDQEIFILNGLGGRFLAKITNINKKEIQLSILKKESIPPQHHIAVALAIPKKSYWEECLVKLVELGCRELYPLITEYSQSMEVHRRAARLIESAIEQSNNPYKLKIHPPREISVFMEENEEKKIFFTNNITAKKSQKVQYSSSEKVIALYGPEAGFSPREEKMAQENQGVFKVGFPCSILRLPTAVATGIGYLFGKRDEEK